MVVLIIGILAAVALPQYQVAVEKSQLSEAFTIMSSLEKAIDVWLLANGNPSEDIYFLGDESNRKGSLDIDIESGMDCSINEGTVCGNKNFAYESYCSDRNCTIYVHRTINGDFNKVPYSVQRMKAFSTGRWHGEECDYFPDEGDIGEKICNSLVAQGDGYYLCENC